MKNIGVIILFVSIFIVSCKSTVYKYSYNGSGTGGDFYLITKKNSAELFIPEYSDISYYNDSIIDMDKSKFRANVELKPKTSRPVIYQYDVESNDSIVTYKSDDNIDSFYKGSKDSYFVSKIPLSERFNLTPDFRYHNYECSLVRDSIFIFDGSFPMEIAIYSLYPVSDKDSVRIRSNDPIEIALDRKTGLPVYALSTAVNSFGFPVTGFFLSDYKTTYISKRRIKKILFL